MIGWSGKIKGVVVMLNGKMQKLIAALVVVGFVGSASLPIIAEASPHRDREEQRIEHRRENRRIEEHRRDEHRRDEHRRDEHRRHRDHESHSDTGNLVTGLIIGGVVGAVIANN